MGNELQTIDNEMAEFDEIGSDAEYELEDGADKEEAADESESEESTNENGEDAEEEDEEESGDDNEDEEEDEGGESEEEESDEEDEDGDDVDEDEDEDEDEDDPQVIIANLRKLVAEQAATKSQPIQQQETTEVDDDVNEVSELPDFTFATEDNFDDIVSDPEAFNKAVNAGIKLAMEHVNKVTQQNAIQAVQLSLPQMVSTQVTEQTNLQSAVNSFYANHPDLVDYKAIVGNNIMTLQGASPDKDLSTLMDEAAELTYKQLALQYNATKKDTSKTAKKGKRSSKNTGLRKGKKVGKSRTNKFKESNLDAFQSELDELK